MRKNMLCTSLVLAGICIMQTSFTNIHGDVLTIFQNNSQPCILMINDEPEYPGGKAAWLMFLNKSIKYPEKAVDKEIEGIVVVQFWVDRNGIVSDAKALTGPEELRAEAVRLINKSGRWVPVVKNGQNVTTVKRQSIKFKLECHSITSIVEPKN